MLSFKFVLGLPSGNVCKVSKSKVYTACILIIAIVVVVVTDVLTTKDEENGCKS
jgi:t-SNARE complex subunit (syntaxin)